MVLSLRGVDADLATRLLDHTPWTVARPSPVPLVRALVVNYGSKIRDTTSGAMPRPESVAPGCEPAGDLVEVERFESARGPRRRSHRAH